MAVVQAIHHNSIVSLSTVAVPIFTNPTYVSTLNMIMESIMITQLMGMVRSRTLVKSAKESDMAISCWVFAPYDEILAMRLFKTSYNAFENSEYGLRDPAVLLPVAKGIFFVARRSISASSGVSGLDSSRGIAPAGEAASVIKLCTVACACCWNIYSTGATSFWKNSL